MMTNNRYIGSLEMILIGESPEAKLSGGARINTIINILKTKKVKINLISYHAYSHGFKIEHKKIDDQLNSVMIHFPPGWPRILKASLLLIFNFVYSLKYSKKSHFILSAGGTMLLQIPVIIVSKLSHTPVGYDYLDIEVEKIPENIYKYFIKKITIIFAISQNLIDNAKRCGCKNVVYLPAFVDTNLFQIDKKARETNRKNSGVTENETIIGYAGALAYTEGIPILLQSLKNLVKKYPKICLFILGTKQVVGQGEEIFELVKDLNLDSKVTFFSPVQHSEVPKFLSTCDILCSPKIDCEVNRAANPIKVVEYLSMGIPAICSSIGEVSILITHNFNGFLAKPGDVKDLENKLEWVISNKNHSKEIGKNGRKTAIERFSFEAIENTIIQSINDAVMDFKKGV
jgi:glycosyltransferase involved in cell wall biosynthesis